MKAQVEHDAREHTVRQLFERLTRETTLLAKEELTLAKAEVDERKPVIGISAVSLAAAMLLGVFSFAAFTAACILALLSIVPPWSAALAVAFAWGAGAAVFARAGRSYARRAWPLMPQTMQTVKENIEWIKTRTKSAAN